MSDIYHGDFCDGPMDDSGDCPVCIARFARLNESFGPWTGYTREDVESAYSEPCETTKRDILIERLGL